MVYLLFLFFVILGTERSKSFSPSPSPLEISTTDGTGKGNLSLSLSLCGWFSHCTVSLQFVCGFTFIICELKVTVTVSDW